jgi:hypothetical protein
MSKYNYRSDKELLEAATHVDYDPESGRISHRERKNSNGSIDRYGYLIVKIKGKQWKAHRLAWAKHYGVAPSYNIDHIDRNKLNNRISNLRDVPQVLNVQNMERTINPDTGVVGIYKDKATPGLRAVYTFRKEGKTHRFRSLKEAVASRELAS